MKILYVAYSCFPNKGSEEKIGWNIPLKSAESNQVIVVTKQEHRQVIEKYISEHNIDNPKFYFVDIPKLHKKIWKGSAYSVRLNIWHRKAFPIIRNICKNEAVDIIHQITPIEFRSIGSYHKIPNTRFVCGPLGGGEYIPSGLKKYAFSHLHIEFIRFVLNQLYKALYFFNKQLSQCDYLLFANRETQNYIKDLIGNVPNELYFDNGISEDEILKTKKVPKKSSEKTTFLIAGRLAYRKGHSLLLDAIKCLPENANCEFRIVGNGPELKKLKRKCKKYNFDKNIVFTGRISYSEMKDEYSKADVFIMPSIRETTGAVLLEAGSNGIPVITTNHFGASVLFNDNCAYFFNGNSRTEYVNSLAEAILRCIAFPKEVRARGEIAQKAVQAQAWDRKLIKYNEIYRKVLNR